MTNEDLPLTECQLCDSKDGVTCKRGFLGFTKCNCSSCGKNYERRLGPGYRVTYWLLGIWTGFVLFTKLPLLINALSVSFVLFLNIIAEYSFFILFFVGSFLALKKDFRLKKEMSKKSFEEKVNGP